MWAKSGMLTRAGTAVTLRQFTGNTIWPKSQCLTLQNDSLAEQIYHGWCYFCPFPLQDKQQACFISWAYCWSLSRFLVLHKCRELDPNKTGPLQTRTFLTPNTSSWGLQRVSPSTSSLIVRETHEDLRATLWVFNTYDGKCNSNITESSRTSLRFT